MKIEMSAVARKGVGILLGLSFFLFGWVYDIEAKSVISAESLNSSILNYKNVILDVIASDYSSLEFAKKMSTQKKGDYVNYFMHIANSATQFLTTGDADSVTIVLDNLMKTFYKYSYFPRPAYHGMKYGWVSAMDAPLIAVLAQIMYEKTEKEEYRKFVSDLSEYILKDVSEHGFVATVDGEKWLFEYANEKTQKENGWFVLNGSLLGTLCTAIIGKVTNNDALKELVSSQTRLYKKLNNRFWYKDGTWNYYMLSKNTPNQPHYVIFEIRLFKALAEVIEDGYYEREAEKRKEMLRNSYPIQVFSKDGDDKKQYMFVRGGAPHYYYVDIFSTQLSFFDKNNNLIRVDKKDGRNFKDAVMVGEWPLDTARVHWCITTPWWTVEIGDLKVIQKYISVPKNIACTFTAGADCELNNGKLQIAKNKSDKNRLELYGKLSQNELVGPSNIIGIEIDNNSKEILSSNIILYDSNKSAIERYLPQIKPGKNMVCFGLLGFGQYGRKTIRDISVCRLRFYSKDLKRHKIQLIPGRVFKFTNVSSLYKILEESSYRMNFGQ